MKSISNRARVKSPYFTADGMAVPGVTTILRVMDKSRYLTPWANRLGLEGVDSTKYADEKAAIGTLAHQMILKDLKGEEFSTYDNTKREIDCAENAFLKYLAWKKKHDINPILVEEKMVSELCRYGGTVDYYGDIDGKRVLLDFKTGNQLYNEAWIQLAGYYILLDERKLPVEERCLLNIGRDETENFIEAKRSGPPHDDEITIFHACRAIYEAKKRLKYD